MTFGGEQKPWKSSTLNGQQGSQIAKPPGCRLIAKWTSLTAATLAEQSFGQRACCTFSSLALGCNVIEFWGDQLGGDSLVDLPPLHLASQFWTEVHIDIQFKLGLAMRRFLLMRITNEKDKPLLMWSF